MLPEISFEGESPGEPGEKCEALVLRWPTLTIRIEAGEYVIKDHDSPVFRAGAHQLTSYAAALEIADALA